jgi:hypothetical protein
VTVLRRAYVPVEPDVTGFDDKLKTDLAKQDPGGKAGRQVGGQLNRALKRLDLDPIDIKADPKKAFAAIEATEEKLRRLSRDSATVEVKIKTERALGELSRFKKKLGDVGGDGGGEAAAGFATRFSSKLGSLLESAPVSPQLVIAAVAAAPVVAAGISAAVIGGAGVGGVIGGLLLVKDDPRVQAAGAEIGQKLLSSLKDDAQPFVEPVLAAIGQIEARFDSAEGRIKHIFSDSSGFVQPLVNGALDGVDGILKGFESLVTKGKPVIDALGKSFSIIGESVGKAFSIISGDSDDAASALTNIAKVAGVLIEATAYLVRGLTELYGIIAYLPGKFKELEFAAAGLVGINKNVTESAAGAATAIAAQVLALAKNSDAAAAAARANGLFVATQDDVKAVQDVATQAQKAYNDSLAALAPAGGRAAAIVDGLRKATQNLYGAQIAAIDANEAYEASWDALSGSIQKNGRTLNIHSAAGRSNRDALEAVASASKDMYFADVQSGIGIAEATKKHNARIAALKEEAAKSHLSKTETDKLVTTYGSIPKGKTTKLVVAGVDSIVSALRDLYVFQRSLADGIPIASEIAKLKGEKGPAKRYGGYAQGGQYAPFSGRLPGPPSGVDNLRGHGPGGDGFGLAGGEFIVNAQQTGKHREMLEDLNAGRNGFAAGGYYPVEQRPFKVTTNAAGTRIPPRSEVEAKVVLPVPAGGRTSDWIVRAARQIVPGIEVLSQDRPGARTLTGNVSYHALGRAVDFHWNRKLAEVWNQRYMSRTKELISPWQDLNIQNGRRHAYSPLVYNQHNFAGGNPHDHIAMANGGVIREPVVGIGASGRTYSFGEHGAETVTPGAGGDVHIHLHNAVITSKRQAVDLVVEAYNTAVSERKIKR